MVGGILMMPGLEPLSPARDHFLRIWEGSKKSTCQGVEPDGLGCRVYGLGFRGLGV